MPDSVLTPAPVTTRGRRDRDSIALNPLRKGVTTGVGRLGVENPAQCVRDGYATPRPTGPRPSNGQRSLQWSPPLDARTGLLLCQTARPINAGKSKGSGSRAKGRHTDALGYHIASRAAYMTPRHGIPWEPHASTLLLAPLSCPDVSHNLEKKIPQKGTDPKFALRSDIPSWYLHPVVPGQTAQGRVHAGWLRWETTCT